MWQLVNEDTFKSSCGSAVFEKICSIKVKGRDDKIKVYRPVESERRITKKLASVRDSEGILGRETLIPSRRPGMALWRESLFAWMSRSATSALDFFHLPPNRVVELGTQVEI